LILLRGEDQKKISQFEDLLNGRSLLMKESHSYLLLLQQWLGGTKKIGSLLYKASRDGFGADDFHRLCNNKGATLTLIESTEGCLFGGYSECEWKSIAGYGTSDKSFLFTLKNVHGIPPTKLDNILNKYSICDHPRYGPTFGGFDLYICNNSNTDKSSYSIHPHSYRDTTGKGMTLFAGNQYFTTKEIEVYQVI